MDVKNRNKMAKDSIIRKKKRKKEMGGTEKKIGGWKG